MDNNDKEDVKVIKFNQNNNDNEDQKENVKSDKQTDNQNDNDAPSGQGIPSK